jgi:hypothetical protein
MRRAEAWFREQQATVGGEVLLLIASGDSLDESTRADREAVLLLMYSLRRRGVVAAYAERRAGAFMVELAPVSAMVNAPARGRRTRMKTAPPAAQNIPSLTDLDPESLALLGDLATRALEGLGIVHTEEFLADEMSRQLGAIAGALSRATDSGAALRAALKLALDQHE